jgi:UDP-N-acetyl-D-galactosamine dehydrogenase
MFVANKVVKLMIAKGITIKGAKALVLGVTFKENCPDIRNSKVINIVQELNQFGLQVDVYDPHANVDAVQAEYKINLIQQIEKGYDAVVLAVSHQEFKLINYPSILNNPSILFDTKAFIDRDLVDGRL